MPRLIQYMCTIKKRIEVVFKFDDILMRAIEKYQKGEKEA